jgi:hypothetical protein
MDHRIWIVHFLALNVRRRIETYLLDLFMVRTISFKLLYGLVILGDGRRRLARVGVTSNPIAEWIAGQVTRSVPWAEAPRYLIRDFALRCH